MQVAIFQWKILVAFLFDSSSKNIIFQWYWPTKVFLFVANDGGAYGVALPTMVALYGVAKLSKSETQTKM